MVERIRNASLTVGTDPSVISEEQFNAQRSVLFIVNTSTGGQSITIAPGDVAVAGSGGIVIGPGGFYQDTIDSGYKPTNSRVTAVSSAAAGTISIHERVIMRGD